MERIEERILQACARSGRARDEIQIMGVSKFQPIAAVEEAWEAGVRTFGENRVWEAVEKFSAFREQKPACELRFIGTLQRNKAKIAAETFDAIDSVDREQLLLDLGNLAKTRSRALGILLELRTAEPWKAGFPTVDALSIGVEKALGLPALDVQGIMTMAPFTGDERLIRASFKSAARAREVLKERFPGRSWTLSMGMSSDFDIAVEEGATMIRVGTALFGERA